MIQRRHLFLGFICAGVTSSTVAASKRPDDTIAFAEYINWMGRQSKAAEVLVVEIKPIDVTDPITGFKSWQEVQRVIPDVNRQAATDLLAQSKQKSSIVIPLSKVNPPVRVIQPLSSEVQLVFETDENLEDQWKKLRKKFEGASNIVRFSNVGYNDTFDQATFVVGMSCGPLCGSGSLVLMQHTPKGWRVVKEVVLWVS